MQLEHEEINWNSKLQNQKAELQKQKTENNFARFATHEKFHKAVKFPFFVYFCLSFCDLFPNYPYVIVFSLYILVIFIVLWYIMPKQHFVKTVLVWRIKFWGKLVEQALVFFPFSFVFFYFPTS